MTGSVGAVGKSREWRDEAARWVKARPWQQKELRWRWRGSVAGRPESSRAVHDRKARRMKRAIGSRFTVSERGRSNPRFEPTPHPAGRGPGCRAGMNSLEPTAVRPPVLNRVMAAPHPAPAAQAHGVSDPAHGGLRKLHEDRVHSRGQEVR